MEKTQFQVEFKWVLDVLTSCVTIEQIQVARNLYLKFMVKWCNNLSDSGINNVKVVYRRIEKLQINKIKKMVHI